MSTETFDPNGNDRKRQRRQKLREDIKDFLRAHPEVVEQWPPNGKRVPRALRLEVVRRLKKEGVVRQDAWEMEVPISTVIKELREEDGHASRQSA